MLLQLVSSCVLRRIAAAGLLALNWPFCFLNPARISTRFPFPFSHLHP